MVISKVLLSNCIFTLQNKLLAIPYLLIFEDLAPDDNSYTIIFFNGEVFVTYYLCMLFIG